MGDQGATRASDADRDSAAATISEHFAAGRLTEEELNARLSLVYQARTLSDLEVLRSDLPDTPLDPARELAQRRALIGRRVWQQVGGGFSAFAVCTLIWIASGANGMFWPAWILIAPVGFLLRNGWALWGPAPDLDQVEAELTRHRRRVARLAERHARQAMAPGDAQQQVPPGGVTS